IQDALVQAQCGGLFFTASHGNGAGAELDEFHVLDRDRVAGVPVAGDDELSIDHVDGVVVFGAHQANDVVAFAAVDRIGAGARHHGVVAFPGGDRVVSGSAYDQVVAAGRDDGVVALAAVHGRVGVVLDGDLVIAVAHDDDPFRVGERRVECHLDVFIGPENEGLAVVLRVGGDIQLASVLGVDDQQVRHQAIGRLEVVVDAVPATDDDGIVRVQRKNAGNGV